MKVVVVNKSTIYETKGDVIERQVLDGKLPASYLEKVRRAHDEHVLTFDRLQRELEKENIEYQVLKINEELPEGLKNPIVIAVGGDGTALAASHLLGGEDGLLVGVRSAKSSIGHLCAFHSEQIDLAVKSLIEGSTRNILAHRMYARVKVFRTDEIVTTLPALNDFLFAHQHPAATARFVLGIGSEYEEHRSSGMWLSTAAGSTAAIRAAGGEPVAMDDDRVQYVVREPYHPSAEDSRFVQGFVDPDEQPIYIENQSESALLCCDGHHKSLRLGWGDRVEIYRAKPIRIVRPND